MTVFSDMTDALFADEDMAVAGTYKPKVGFVQSVRVMMRREEDGEGLFSTGAVVGRLMADISTSELPAAVEGDTLTIDDTSYLVASVERRDTDRLIWSLSLTE